MKKIAFLLMATTCLFVLSLTGCGGGGDSQVIQAPDAPEEDPVMDGISDEDYDAAMDAEENE